MYLYRKAQRDREKEEELRIITEERNARNAELQRRIELRKLAKLKKKKQEEVPKHTKKSLKNVQKKKVDEAVIQSAELVVRELTEIVTNKVEIVSKLCQNCDRGRISRDFVASESAKNAKRRRNVNVNAKTARRSELELR